MRTLLIPCDIIAEMMALKMIKTYSELISLPTFKERYEYLKIGGKVGTETFGFDRFLNQAFYKSREWLPIRDRIIVRDNGCDLAMEGFDIFGRIIVHHLNPITLDDILEMNDLVLNPEYLVCVSHMTHQAIHYGDANLLPKGLIERRKNDTCPWLR